jgi:hypothetical protein
MYRFGQGSGRRSRQRAASLAALAENSYEPK